jgi:hypothetical protein
MNLCGLARAATRPLAADVFQPKHPGVLPKVMTAPVSVVGLRAARATRPGQLCLCKFCAGDAETK